jgi:hypothetical protein
MNSVPKVGREDQHRALGAEVGIGLDLIKLKVTTLVCVSITQLERDG